MRNEVIEMVVVELVNLRNNVMQLFTFDTFYKVVAQFEQGLVEKNLATWEEICVAEERVSFN